MKVILVGANGTIGKHVQKALASKNIEVIKVGKRSGDFQVNIEDAEDVARLYKKIGGFGPLWIAKVTDAINGAIPVGSVAYGPESRKPLLDILLKQS